MANVSTIRNAMAAQIEANAQPYLSAVGDPYDQITPPTCIILPGKPFIKYGSTMGGHMLAPDGNPIETTDMLLNAMIIISDASTKERVQDSLDQWLGVENGVNDQGQMVVSVPMAIALDPTLGGVVEWCEPQQVSQYGPIDYAGTTYFGATIVYSVGAR